MLSRAEPLDGSDELVIHRKIRDPHVEGRYVYLTAAASQVVDTPYFQRLRYLSQLVSTGLRPSRNIVCPLPRAQNAVPTLLGL